jgi:hypothetical protein
MQFIAYVVCCETGLLSEVLREVITLALMIVDPHSYYLSEYPGSENRDLHFSTTQYPKPLCSIAYKDYNRVIEFS